MVCLFCFVCFCFFFFQNDHKLFLRCARNIVVVVCGPRCLPSAKVHGNAHSLNFTVPQNYSVRTVRLLLWCFDMQTCRCCLPTKHQSSSKLAKSVHGMKGGDACRLLFFPFMFLLTGLVIYSICSLDLCFSPLQPIALEPIKYNSASVTVSLFLK